MKYRCWSCQGKGGFGGEHRWIPCNHCQGTGQTEGSRLDGWARSKAFLGSRDPEADKNGNEKFVRLGAEVPPEFLPMLKQAFRNAPSSGKHEITNADIVRVALWEFLAKYLPEEPAPIEGTASDVIVLPAISERSED